MVTDHRTREDGLVGMVRRFGILVAILTVMMTLGGTGAAFASDLVRILLIPIRNADGRSRVPLRMGVHRGTDS
jgi:hypothetical protein